MDFSNKKDPEFKDKSCAECRQSILREVKEEYEAIRCFDCECITTCGHDTCQKKLEYWKSKGIE